MLALCSGTEGVGGWWLATTLLPENHLFEMASLWGSVGSYLVPPISSQGRMEGIRDQ